MRFSFSTFILLTACVLGLPRAQGEEALSAKPASELRAESPAPNEPVDPPTALDENPMMDPTAMPLADERSKPAPKKRKTKKTVAKAVTSKSAGPTKGAVSAPKTTAAQSAAVGLDGATVYDAPDFDARPLIQLAPGYKVQISRKTIPGRAGLGTFYRIKYDKNKLGFVADTEMIPEFQLGTKRKEKNPVFDKVEDLRERATTGRKPLSETRYLGASFSRVSYQERYKGKLLDSDVMMYGVRFSGPGVFFDGPPLDFNLSFTPTAPDHYQKLTGTPASGMMIMVDTMMMVNIYEWSAANISGGLGPLINYTRFRIKDGFQYVDANHFRLGAVAELGAAYRHKKLAGRFDVRYQYENSAYLSYMISLQHEY